MGNMKYIIVTLLSVSLLLVLSCAGDENKGLQDTAGTENDSTEQGGVEYYQIPSPVALFEFVSMTESKYNKKAPAPLDLTPAASKDKALTLGFYLADLTYELAYKNINRSGELLDRISTLTRDLHISGALEGLAKRTRDNLTNYDSLKIISSDTYEDVQTFLEDKDRGSMLALIVTGAWIEGLYLAMNTYEYNPENAANQRIADQKIIFKNVSALLNKYKKDTNVDQCLAMLRPVQMVFDRFEARQVEDKHVPDDPDVIVVGDDQRVYMSKENYQALKQTINQLRSSIIDY